MGTAVVLVILEGGARDGAVYGNGDELCGL